MRFLLVLAAGLAAATATASPTLAQSNLIGGLNVELGFLDGLNDVGHEGTFPNGVAGFAMSTTSCNNGTVESEWEAAMDPDHPFIAFQMARESGGRLVQISDHSWVKHGFFALSNNQCGYGCSSTDGTALGVGCSDTYGIGNNGDRFWLGRRRRSIPGSAPGTRPAPSSTVRTATARAATSGRPWTASCTASRSRTRT